MSMYAHSNDPAEATMRQDAIVAVQATAEGGNDGNGWGFYNSVCTLPSLPAPGAGLHCCDLVM